MFELLAGCCIDHLFTKIKMRIHDRGQSTYKGEGSQGVDSFIDRMVRQV